MAVRRTQSNIDDTPLGDRGVVVMLVAKEAEPFNRDQVISELFVSPDLAAAIGKMEPAQLRDDLRQELFVMLCEMEGGKLQGLHERKELRWFVVATMRNMIMSNRSTFYITHRRYNEQMLSPMYAVGTGGLTRCTQDKKNAGGVGSPEGTSDNAMHVQQPEGLIHHDLTEPGLNWLELVSEAVDELDEYEAGMIRLYADMGRNCQNIAKATDIQARSVRYVVTQAKIKLQKKLRANV